MGPLASKLLAPGMTKAYGVSPFSLVSLGKTCVGSRVNFHEGNLMVELPSLWA